MYENQVDRSMGEDIEHFNNTFSVDFILRLGGWTQDEKAQPITYLQRIVYSQYVSPSLLNYDKVTVNIDNRWHTISIYTQDRLELSGSFDCYVHFVMGRDVNQALNWKNDLRLHNPSLPNVNLHMTQHQPITIMEHYGQSHQQWSHQQQYQTPPPRFSPMIDIDFILDNTAPKDYLQLDSCILDQNSIVKKLMDQISDHCDVPPSTILCILLGTFSGMSCKKWNVTYEDGRTVPIGLYVVAEQPSGAGKSRVLNLLQEPLIAMAKTLISNVELSIKNYYELLNERIEMLEEAISKEDKAENKKLIAKIKSLITQLDKKLARIQNMMPITNATPDALDKILQATNGYFLASSAEQGLFNSLLGLSYGKRANNNDIMLNGRDGGDVNSSRVARKSYIGKVVGTTVCFAQEKSIEKLLSASDVTGLAERFLMISEPNYVGSRDHARERIGIDSTLAEYVKKCEFFRGILEKDTHSYDTLITLKISPQCWGFIHSFENNLEKHLGNNGDLSHPILQRIVSKTRMQVMGIASNLYLLDTDTQPLTQRDNLFIPQEYVIMAINIYNKVIFGVRDYCEQKGLINDNAQISTVFNMFIGKGENASFTEQELKKKCEQIKPFKDLESPRIAVKNTIDYLAKNYVLLKNDGKYYRNPEKYGGCWRP